MKTDTDTVTWDAGSLTATASGRDTQPVNLDVTSPGTDTGTRNDADIARAANNELRWLSQLPQGAVHVSVRNGWATLSGEVDAEHQRQSAAVAVRSLPGVAGVSNQIAVKFTVSSSTIKSSIVAALMRSSAAGMLNISIEVRGDNVTLIGTVPNWMGRELAKHVAWGTPGVRNVINNIVVAK